MFWFVDPTPHLRVVAFSLRRGSHIAFACGCVRVFFLFFVFHVFSHGTAPAVARSYLSYTIGQAALWVAELQMHKIYQTNGTFSPDLFYGLVGTIEFDQ